MARKILLISPTPTHPTNAGNRIRILNMAGYLMDLGHEVHFLYSRQEDADEQAMEKYWGDRYFAVDYKKPEPTPGQKLRRRLLQRINYHYQFYCTVDEHYNILLDDKINELHSKHQYDTVLVEYIFLSKAFLNFSKEVLKVIDTHDVMTDRHKLFLKEGKKPIWYSTPFREEKKGIRRADVIIAIQEREKDHFNRMTFKKVINVGHMVKLREEVLELPRKKLLFVGSNNPSNHYGILEFLEVDFPMVRRAYPDMELLITGNICGRLEEVPEGVVLLGEVEDLAKAYDQVDLVINPLKIGTGLKIKMIEAMGLSKVVLSTPVGAEGLEDSAGSGYLLYRNRHELVEGITETLENQERYRELCRGAAETARNWNAMNGAGLLEVFGSENDPVSGPVAHLRTGQNLSLSKDRLKDIVDKYPSIVKFVIISVPRSGSNLVVGMLEQHPEIQCYPELFHPDKVYDRNVFAEHGLSDLSREERDKEPLEFLDQVFQHKFKANTKATGFKMFPGQNDELMNLLMEEPGVKKIILERENLLRCYLSQKTAEESNVYFVREKDGITPEEKPMQVDVEDFLAYEEKTSSFFNTLKRKLDGSGQHYLEVQYIHLLEKEQQAELLDYLGVSPDTDLLKVVSKKQRTMELKDKIINYDEVGRHLSEMGRESYLNEE
jgi:hypothetical protein